MPRARGPRAGLAAAYGLGILITAAVLAAMDRQILVLLAEPMRQSLGLSDTQVGLLQGLGVTLFAGLAAVPVGWLADRFGRRRVLALCVLVWTAATAACGLAQDFGSLFLAAVALGIGAAGLTPIVYGLIPDIVSDRRRALANGIYTLAAILGAGLGIALSGALVEGLGTLRALMPPSASQLESWRLAFLCVALPGPLVALLILLIRVRRVQPAAPAGVALGAGPRAWPYLSRHRRTVLGMFGGAGLAGLGLAAVSNWLPVVAARSFGATPAEVGQGIGLAYLAGTAVGAGGAFWAVRRLAVRHGPATPVRITSWGLVLAAGVSLCMPAASQPAHLYILFALQVASLIAASVLAPTMLQDMTPSVIRSRLIAVGGLVSVSMASISPPLVGMMSDFRASTPGSLLWSVSLVSAFAMAAGAALMRTAEAPFVRTVDAVRLENATADAGPSGAPGMARSVP